MFSRTKWTGLVATLAAAIVMFTGQPASGSVNRVYGFEHGFGGWSASYFGQGAYTMERTTEQAYAGQFSMECYVDGTDGSGTAWLAQEFRAPVQTVVKLNLTFQLYSPEQSDVNNFAVVAYVGTTPPRSQDDFQVIGYAGTTAGWSRYTFNSSQLTGRDPTYVWVAFGISSVWEYSREYYMDNVTVSIKP